MALTAKQQRFVEEYLIDLNATQAAIRAGYSKKTANEQGSRLLANVSVSAAVAESMKSRSGRTGITQDMVLKELAKIGFSDIRKVVRWGETQLRLIGGEEDEGDVLVPYHGLALIDSSAIDDETAGAIAEVSQGKEGLKVKLHDKKGALVDIGRHLGMFVPAGHADLDAELKRLEIEKKRAEIKRLQEDGDEGQAPQRVEVIVRDARKPDANP
ncbi:terminase small subunit [Pseudomonas putida]|uniref:Terminase small subunit n=1 Tax=Pseudomonas putida TaxID=303 RepID=A0A7D6AB07_PSEPU|nr:terminase small subunit [Pseudomonas putida]QLJ16264.1 terminase small subunit [Pseudomonas putida]